jgi:hypothetical protein
MASKCAFAALASLSLFSGCANLAEIAPPVTPAMAGGSGGASLETLQAGREIYTKKCTACHSPEPVARRSFEQWREIVGKMSERTKLTTAEEETLLAYLRVAPRAATSQPAP